MLIMDKVKILAPAKINIFLKVLGRKKNGMHVIRTGITFINIFDEITINLSDKNSIEYVGPFSPSSKNYNDCIMLKTLQFLRIKNNSNFKIKVYKNIPVQGGLGSASTNAAALIKGLQKMDLIEKKKPTYYAFLGSDIPCFLLQKNCLALGQGEKLYPQIFPNYYFLLVKPNFNNSTKEMYFKLNIKKNTYLNNSLLEDILINEEDTGNDFEHITLSENQNFKTIFEFVQNLDNAIFTRMTGSGSCFYAAFLDEEHAKKAQNYFKKTYANEWSIICNNHINSIN